MAGGECRIFQRPEFAVKGAKRYDQDWIDGNTEAGVGGCGWERPKPRPATLDADGAGPKIAQAAPAPVAPRRSGIWQRTKERVKKIVPRRTPGIVTPAVAAPAPEPPPSPLAAPIGGTPATFDPPTPAPEPAEAPLPAPKRKPIDDLLQPRK